MIATRFPTSGLTSEYGDIILSDVDTKVTLEITFDGDVILEEEYTPDADGVVYIRDIGKLALLYMPAVALSLNQGVDGSSIIFSIDLVEGGLDPDIIEQNVTFYRTDIDFIGSITPELIMLMPLSRATTKTTGQGRKEFISFYDSNIVKLYAVFSNGTADVGVTVDDFLPMLEDGDMYRVNVSPAVVAAAVGCTEAQLVYYNVYQDTAAIIRFKMDHRSFVNKTTFVFRNAFGAQETFTCVGHDVKEGKWDREYGVIHNSVMQTARDKSEQIKVQTGFVMPGMVDVIDDLLNSDAICVLEGSNLVPVVILEEDFTRTTRKNEPRSYQITYRYASNYIKATYTPFVKPGVFSETFDETFE